MGLSKNIQTGPFKFDEEYVIEGSAEYAGETFNNDSFGNMDIKRETYSNYSKEGNAISIDAETRRLHDDIEEPVTYSTRYNIAYDPETL